MHWEIIPLGEQAGTEFESLSLTSRFYCCDCFVRCSTMKDAFLMMSFLNSRVGCQNQAYIVLVASSTKEYNEHSNRVNANINYNVQHISV